MIREPMTIMPRTSNAFCSNDDQKNHAKIEQITAIRISKERSKNVLMNMNPAIYKGIEYKVLR